VYGVDGGSGVILPNILTEGIVIKAVESAAAPSSRRLADADD
jgi:hypothetical protein